MLLGRPLRDFNNSVYRIMTNSRKSPFWNEILCMLNFLSFIDTNSVPGRIIWPVYLKQELLLLIGSPKGLFCISANFLAPIQFDKFNHSSPTEGLFIFV